MTWLVICAAVLSHAIAADDFNADRNFTPYSSTGSGSSLADSSAGGSAGGSAGSSGSSSGGSSSSNAVAASAAADISTSSTTSSTAESTSSTAVALAPAAASTAAVSPEAQDDALSAAVTSPAVVSTTSTAETQAQAVQALQAGAQSLPSSTSSTTSQSSAQNASSDSSTSSSDDTQVQSIREALFQEAPSPGVKIMPQTLYAFYEWMVKRQVSRDLVHALYDPFGVKSVRRNTAVMSGAMVLGQPVALTYPTMYTDMILMNLNIQSPPKLKALNVLVSDILTNLCFPHVNISSSGNNNSSSGNNKYPYEYTTPQGNILNNKSRLGYHAGLLVDAASLGSNDTPLGKMVQQFIYLNALSYQFKSCSSNYTQTNSSTSTSSGISSVIGSMGTGSGQSGQYFSIPQNTWSNISKNISSTSSTTTLSQLLVPPTYTAPALVTCNGSFTLSSNEKDIKNDATGNGFPGILNVLNYYIVNNSNFANTDISQAKEAVMSNRMPPSDVGNMDALQCMNAATSYGEQATILCYKANIAYIEVIQEFTRVKASNSTIMTAGFGSSSADGLTFVKNMSKKVDQAVSSLKNILPVMVVYQLMEKAPPSKAMVTQMVPSASISALPALTGSAVGELFDVSPQVSNTPANTSGSSSATSFIKDRITGQFPVPEDISAITSSMTSESDFGPHLQYTGVYSIANGPTNSQSASSDSVQNILASMSSQSFMDTLLNAQGSSVYFNGVPFPTDTFNITSSSGIQWVSIAGAFYRFTDSSAQQSTSSSPSWPFALLPGTNPQVVIVPNTLSMMKTLGEKRSQYLTKLSTALKTQEKNQSHNASVGSFTSTIMTNYRNDRSIMQQFTPRQSANGLQAQDNIAKTPTQILIDGAQWRFNPEFGWQKAVAMWDTNELLREMLYLMVEQNGLITRLVLDGQDMKLMKAVDVYTQLVNSSPMGGPSNTIDTNVENYVTGTNSRKDMSDPSAMAQETQDQVQESMQAATSVTPASVAPPGLNPSATAVLASLPSSASAS